ncbi:unnamed protein product [Rhizophagus irregularis]|uniref:Kinase-like protein n=1 Tax=Rhizophagus irregularis TaxID=588596 RepID=A0A2N1NS43_9GLOM|nr:kinase-like protein [Rhizophagus irregularis]CAB4392655.1 unnamed protein product [Rhizophagus irregularis]
MASLNEWIDLKIKDGDINYFEYDEFTNIEKVGEGAFGIVNRADWKSGEIKVALKVLTRHSTVGENNMKKFLKELNNLRKVCFHPNINQFFGITKEPISNNYMMVLQYANQGNLREYLKNKFNSLEWNDKIQLSLDITRGLKCLHSRKIIHRDLHAKNILVHKDKPMIADLGLSKQLSADTTSSSTVYGMPAYIDPQCYKNENYIRDKKSDIYSLGVLLWEITSGCPPFSKSPVHIVNIKVASGIREQPIINTPLAYVNLYKKCWDDNPDLRPTVDEVFDILERISLQDLQDNTITNNEINPNIIKDLNKLILNSNNSDLTNQDDSQSSQLIVSTNIDLSQQISTPLSSVLPSINEDEIGLNNTLNEIIIAYINYNNKGETRNFNFDKVLRKYESKSKEIFNYLLSNPNIQHHKVMIGKFYNEGFGCSKDDYNKALEWYIEASQQNDINGHYEVGHFYFCEGNYVKTLEYINLAINNGLNIALSFLAYCYKFGYAGLETDYIKAFELYKTLSEKGFIPSQYELAKCYNNSIGTQEDKNEALKWYKLYQKNDGECDVTSTIVDIENELEQNK